MSEQYRQRLREVLRQRVREFDEAGDPAHATDAERATVHRAREILATPTALEALAASLEKLATQRLTMPLYARPAIDGALKAGREALEALRNV